MITAVNALPIHSNNSKNISKNIAFGNNEQQKTNTNNQNTDFYKTNTGLKTGIGYAIVGQLFTGVTNKIIDIVNKNNQQISKKIELMPKISLPVAAWSVITSLGCGAIADKLINKKREKLAADMKTKDAQTLMKEDKNIQKTEKGNLYYKSNISDKIGPMLGVGVFALNTVINVASRAIKKQPVRFSLWNAVDMLLTASAGGWILGSIADKYSNKAAVAHADSKTNS